MTGKNPVLLMILAIVGGILSGCGSAAVRAMSPPPRETRVLALTMVAGETHGTGVELRAADVFAIDWVPPFGSDASGKSALAASAKPLESITSLQKQEPVRITQGEA